MSAVIKRLPTVLDPSLREAPDLDAIVARRQDHRWQHVPRVEVRELCGDLAQRSAVARNNNAKPTQVPRRREHEKARYPRQPTTTTGHTEAIPHTLSCPCIPFLAHVRILLQPQGENDGFAQLPHTIRLKRIPHGHAETPPHTPFDALANDYDYHATEAQTLRTQRSGECHECANMPAFDGASGLQAHLINPQVHAKYMTRGKSPSRQGR